MKKSVRASNDLSKLAVSYIESDAFYELQSPRLIEKSGAVTPYLFDKLVEGLSVENDESNYTDRGYTPRASSAMDRSNKRIPYKIQPENTIILYKIINPEEIISRCKNKQQEVQIKSKRITPKSSFVSLSKRYPPNTNRSPVLLERNPSKLIRNSSTRRYSARSPVYGTEDRDKTIGMDSYRVTNSTPESIRTQLQIASITKNRLKLLRPRESSKENTTVNRTFNCMSYESTRASITRQKEQSSVKLINLFNPAAKSNSVKTIPSKVKDTSFITKAHSPIKLMYSKSSKHTVTKNIS